MNHVKRCNPYASAKAAKEADLKSAAPIEKPLVIPEDPKDRSVPVEEVAAQIYSYQPNANFIQNKKKEDNLEPGKLQSVAGENKIGKGFIGEGVHDIAMKSGDPYPDNIRDRLKAQNSMWTYPSSLDPSMKPHAH